MNTKDINHFLWGTKNPTLSEYLIKLAQLQLGQDAKAPEIAKFVEDRSVFFLNDVYQGDILGYHLLNVTRFRVEWLQVSDTNIWLAAEDNNRNWWIGTWNSSDKKYYLSSSICFYSNTPQITERQTALDNGDVITGGPIHLHPKSKAPTLAYYRNIDVDKRKSQSTEESGSNLESFTFHVAYRDNTRWKKCDNLGPIVVSLPTRYKAKSADGSEQLAAETPQKPAT